MKRLLAATVLPLLLPFSAFAGQVELIPYASGQYFTWQEHNGGRRILKESGGLAAVGFVAGTVLPSAATLRGKVEFFGGEVGYSGETQAPQSAPVSTDVGYFGSKSEFDLGYRVPVGSGRLEPFAGVGYRWWLRDLHSTTGSDGLPVIGYTEWWRTAYGRFGARGGVSLSDGVALTAEAGAKYPFYNGNTVDFAGSGKTTFRPGDRWSGFAETGITYKRFTLALLYEGFRFAQSPLKQVQSRYYFQPESSSDIVGLRIGWNFR